MQPYVEWMRENVFWVKEFWDPEAQEMSAGDPVSPGGRLVLDAFQERILGYPLTEGADGRFPITTLVYSCRKKSGKTTIAASIAAWYADQSAPGTEIYVIANDKEQAAGRVFQDLTFHYKHEMPEAHITAYRIELPNGTVIQALAKEYKSAAGARHGLTVYDELWGYMTESSRRMYTEMTPIPTVKRSLRVIVTYAGWEGESDLLWELYLRGVGPEEHEQGEGQPVPGLEDLPVWQNGRLYTYWDHDARMPWQTDEYYEEEAKDLRPSEFLRVHLNKWTTGTETFLPPEWWGQAAQAYTGPADLWVGHPYRLARVHVGVDVAPKHDCSAVVGVTYDANSGKVSVLFHMIWTPHGEIDLEATVEAYIIQQSKRYLFGSVDYDPYQFHRSMITLRNQHRIPMREFPQNEANMTAASQQLYDLLKYRKLLAYPDVEAAKHVRNAVAKNTGRGFRIIKDPALRKGTTAKRTSRPVDFAVALAMACYAAVELGAVPAGSAGRLQAAFSDQTTWKHPQEASQEWLPFPLRS